MKEDYNISQDIINKLRETSKSSNVTVDSLIKRLIEVYERDFSKVTMNVENSVLDMLTQQAQNKDIMLDAYVNNILKAYLNSTMQKNRKDTSSNSAENSNRTESRSTKPEEKSPEDVLNDILNSSDTNKEKPNVDL